MPEIDRVGITYVLASSKIYARSTGIKQANDAYVCHPKTPLSGLYQARYSQTDLDSNTVANALQAHLPLVVPFLTGSPPGIPSQERHITSIADYWCISGADTMRVSSVASRVYYRTYVRALAGLSRR